MIARGTGYNRGNREAGGARLVAHFKYIEHRSRTESESRDDRRIFSKDEDVVNRKDAVDDVMDHTSTSVNYHKIVLSPGEDEPVQDWREWTREVMADLEESQGKELHWYAVKHDNTDNPHVHVVLAGSGENYDTGREEPVKMYAQDYKLMRESGLEHSDHEWYRQIGEQLREYDQQDDREFGGQSQERDLGRDDSLDRGDFER
jgi:type IV secretory pathway VirD2 relaxase